MKQVFIHLGPPKTGTTTLQTSLFPLIRAAYYHEWPSEVEYPYFFKFMYSDGIYLDNDLYVLAKKDVARMLHKSDLKNHIFSREHLLHHRFDKEVILNRLKQLFPGARIIITMRNQIEALKSSYLHDLRGLRRYWAGGIPPRSFNCYINNNKGNLFKGEFNSRIVTYDYYSIIQSVTEKFGPENLLLFLFEEMVDEPKIFSKKFFTVFDEDPAFGFSIMKGQHKNPAITNMKVRYYSALAYLLPPIMHRALYSPICKVGALFDRGEKYAITPDTSTLDYLYSHYSKGNQDLIKEFGLNLSAYNYPV